MINYKIIITVILVFLVALSAIFFFKENEQVSLEKVGENENVMNDEKENQQENNKNQIKNKESGFIKDGLKTNTANIAIPLDQILDGGPGKDGIPSLTNPKFKSVKESGKDIALDVDGMVVSVGDIVKFYPFNIMVWHEIVNDIVKDKPLVITFCPLCGSAIVFDTKDKFGVSGKLYESNLLMYDQKTESLWSQSTGKAVVGDRMGESLSIYNSQLMSFGDFTEKWPNGLVLSSDTGFKRNYDFYPYGSYNDNDDLFFPISVKDNRLPTKELMYVVNAYGKSVAFPVKQLSSSVESIEVVSGKKITASIVDGEVIIKDHLGKRIPGYNEMWFSWATQHQKDGAVWTK